MQNNQQNRLHLNFGFNNNNNDRNFAAEQGRAYPTTPSTFPQPVYPNQNGQQEVWGTQQGNNAYGGAGYFVNPQGYSAPYQPGMQPPPQQAFRTPQGYNDGTNGLVHQFSNQNLGTPRSGSPYGRQPTTPNAQRPRTAGSSGQPQQYGGYLSAHMPGQHQPSLNDDEPPPKNPDKYTDNIIKRSRLSTGLVSDFFRQSVQRARDRNAR